MAERLERAMPGTCSPAKIAAAGALAGDSTPPVARKHEPPGVGNPSDSARRSTCARYIAVAVVRSVVVLTIAVGKCDRPPTLLLCLPGRRSRSTRRRDPAPDCIDCRTAGGFGGLLCGTRPLLLAQKGEAV